MPAAAATQMQSQMEGFTKAKSLNAILVQARTLPLGSPSSTSASAPVAIASAAPALDLQALLIGIVAERTGYPHEMLGLDADLEADLRSEERRVGKECVGTCRSRGSPYH